MLASEHTNLTRTQDMGRLTDRFTMPKYEKIRQYIPADHIFPPVELIGRLFLASIDLSPEEIAAEIESAPDELETLSRDLGRRVIAAAAYDLARTKGTLTSSGAALATLEAELTELRELGCMEG
jgi:F0F1-type ATP synthase beta subunit